MHLDVQLPGARVHPDIETASNSNYVTAAFIIISKDYMEYKMCLYYKSKRWIGKFCIMASELWKLHADAALMSLCAVQLYLVGKYGFFLKGKLLYKWNEVIKNDICLVLKKLGKLNSGYIWEIYPGFF